MKANNRRIGTAGWFRATALPIVASALATLAPPVWADSSILNRSGVYEQTLERPTWPHHVGVKFVASRANEEHPTVIVARKFKPNDHQPQLRLHPAGLALAAEPPHSLTDQSPTASLKLE